jgi:hypothetical protein
MRLTRLRTPRKNAEREVLLVRTLASFCPSLLLLWLLAALATGLGAPARADVIDDEPVPGLEPGRRTQPAPPPPPPAAPRPTREEPAPAPAMQRSAPPVAAPAMADDAWRFSVATYLWLPRTTGTQTIDGISADVDISFRDLVEEFDVLALTARLEAHKRRFGFYLDTFYQDVDGDFGSSQGLRARTELDQVRVDFGAFWHALDAPVGDSRIHLSPYVGGRFTWLKQIVRLSVPGRGVSPGGRESWWEPVVGARAVWEISKPFSILVQGDAGGFGVGSDLTWQAAAAFQYRFTDWFQLNLGYYVYDVDYSTGSGRNEFGYDVRQHGPRIGLQFNL